MWERGCVKDWESLFQFLAQYQKSVVGVVRMFMRLLHEYPDKRIIWLAKYHPKARVRKKNIKRICKWMSLMCEKGGESDA